MNSFFAHCRIVCFLILASCWPETAPGKAPAVEDRLDVKLGVDGHFRLGEWAALTIRTSADLDAACDSIEIETSDAESNPVTMRVSPERDSSVPGTLTAWFKLGNRRSRLVVSLLSRNGQRLASQTIEFQNAPRAAGFPRVHPVSTRLVVLIGVPEELHKSISPASLTADSEAPTVLVPIPSFDHLPLSPVGLSNVEMIVFSASSADSLASASPARLNQLRDWTRQGGKFLWWTSPENVSAVVASDLKLLIPGRLEEFGPLKSSSRLDFLIKAKRPLIPIGGEGFPIALLQAAGGLELLTQDQQPLLIKQQQGFGQVIFSALTLDQAPLLEWEGTGKLLEHLILQSKLGAERNTDSRLPIGSAGFLDLVNQLRIPLEQFQQVKFISFTTVALLIGLLLLLVGPADYFLLRGLLRRRMELTWVTFPIMIAAFCGLAYWMAREYRPAEQQFNEFELVDIDSLSGLVRGTNWTGIYSPQSGLRTVSGSLTGSLPIESHTGRVSWMTLPEPKSSGILGATERPYQLREYEFDPTVEVRGRLLEVPFPVRSTRTFIYEWTGGTEFPIRSRLKYDAAIGRLGGTLTNPFDVPLKSCKIFYDTWAYVLDQPIGPGDTLDLLTEGRERTVKSILTQRDRLSADGKTQNAPWDPLETDPRRILEVLLFHEAAGGQGYTGLTSRVHAALEMSEHLELKNALLIAELAEPVSQLALDGKALTSGLNRRYSVLRIVLPVETIVDGSKSQ